MYKTTQVVKHYEYPMPDINVEALNFVPEVESKDEMELLEA